MASAGPAILRLAVKKPVWWSSAMWLTAKAYAIRAAITGHVPSDEKVESIVRWFANRLIIKAV